MPSLRTILSTLILVAVAAVAARGLLAAWAQPLDAPDRALPWAGIDGFAPVTLPSSSGAHVAGSYVIARGDGALVDPAHAPSDAQAFVVDERAPAGVLLAGAGGAKVSVIGAARGEPGALAALAIERAASVKLRVTDAVWSTRSELAPAYRGRAIESARRVVFYVDEDEPVGPIIDMHLRMLADEKTVVWTKGEAPAQQLTDAVAGASAPCFQKRAPRTPELDTKVLTCVVREARPDVEACAQRERASLPNGKVYLTISVAPDGRVESARFKSAVVNASAAGECVRAVARGWRMAPFFGDTTDVEIPLILR